MRTKCKVDGRYYESRETAELLSTHADNPQISKGVLRPLMTELKTERIWEAICPSCAQDRVVRFLEDNSSNKFELTDDELLYGTQ